MRPSPRTRDLLELTIGYTLILATLWTPNPTQRILYWVAFAWIALTAILRRRQVETHGLGLRGLLPSLWIVAAAILIALAGIALAIHLHTLHPLYGPLPVVAHLLGYALWALMQQFILQIYVLTRFLRLGILRYPAIALATILFAASHVPNPVLVALTVIWGAVSCALFLRYRNLYTLALAHGILGMCLAVTVPNPIARHMCVGLGYLHYARTHHPSASLQSPVSCLQPLPSPASRLSRLPSPRQAEILSTPSPKIQSNDPSEQATYTPPNAKEFGARIPQTWYPELIGRERKKAATTRLFSFSDRADTRVRSARQPARIGLQTQQHHFR